MSSDQAVEQAPPQDHVDHILEQWAQQRPDLDVSPMGIIGRMSRLSRFLERSIATVLAGSGLNEPQFAVLAALRRAGPPHTLSPTDLYNALLVSSGAMTNRLERLATAGLVERIPDPGDGRSLLVALTDKGQKVINEAVAAHTANEHRLLSSLTVEERAQLAEVLRRLLLQFEDRPPPTRSRDPGRAPDATGRSSPRRSAGAAR
ncbi:MAG TPA: MarR family transcriptional regulator [Actinomycetes bacterium]|nr:MarR family transcriptional regulator [Actinomycetes bacterium]